MGTETRRERERERERGGGAGRENLLVLFHPHNDFNDY